MILHARKCPITQHPSAEPQTQQYPGQPLTSSRPRHAALRDCTSLLLPFVKPRQDNLSIGSSSERWQREYTEKRDENLALRNVIEPKYTQMRTKIDVLLTTKTLYLENTCVMQVSAEKKTKMRQPDDGNEVS